MNIKRGVSLYSYQQSQFFKELMLDDQLAEVGAMEGVDGIEIIDEMSLVYPEPAPAFFDHWYQQLDRHALTPVAVDVGMDVLQFRDHVMSHEECAERLRRDIRLAARLGFPIVRVLSTTPLDVMIRAQDEAARQGIRIGKEVHQPMSLAGAQVTEIFDEIARTGTDRLGIVPDMGIFQFKPSQAQLDWFGRKGAQSSAIDAVVALCEAIRSGEHGDTFDVSLHTAGNIRSDFKRFLVTGEAPAAIRGAFEGIRDFTDAHVTAPREIDYVLVGEALTFSDTTGEMLTEVVPHITHIHGKFNLMTEVPGQPGVYDEPAIDYVAAISALKAGGFKGYINSEYEGQRYYQDRTREDLMSEVDQVRMHQSMLARLIAEDA